MNLVQTLPELQQASLNGIRGLGYAETIANDQQAGVVRGVIVFDEGADVEDLNADNTSEALFEGTVYRDGFETVETLAVEVLLLSAGDQAEPGATFVGRV